MKTIALKINGKLEKVLLNEDRDYDRITAKHTAFSGFSDLLHAAGGYRPSIYLGGKSKQAKRELVSLIFEYDRLQAGRKDPRRVFAGDFQFA